MLFYQRERSKDDYHHPWFPQDVPYEIIKKYNIEGIFKNDK